MTVESAGQSSGRHRQFANWARRVGLTRTFEIALAVAAIASGTVTYITLTRAPPNDPDPDTVMVLLTVDLALLLVLVALVCGRIVQYWAARRRGSAGSRLMTRLVILFSVVAAAPAIVVTLFSALFFNLGIEAWFSERVRTALSESLAVTSAYLDEQERSINADILAMASDLNAQALTLAANPPLLRQVLVTQAALRSLPEAIIFDARGRVLASTTLSFSLRADLVPGWAMQKANAGEVAILTSESEDRVRALVQLTGLYDTYLYIGRIVSGKVLGHIKRTTEAVQEYERLEGKSTGLQISFFMLFAVVALLLVVAAVWLGLMFADQIARPISALVAAAERVRGGDLAARVDEGPVGDEIGTLARAFNRMTSQLDSQRQELIEANRQLDDRRRFTETVLAGVSAGVIGLDSKARIDLPNRSASELLQTDVGKLKGRPLAKAIPEMAELVAAARAKPDRLAQAEVKIVRGGRARTLLVRVAAERAKRRTIGYVITFDDITELQAAQRKAAWSDVARRIAHEIKNPLTPIQLSAERLKRKYLGKVGDDSEVFEACTDTIIRHVDDIGRMVDEFSAFARMPVPVMKPMNLSTLCREAVFLQSSAHRDIDYQCDLPDSAIELRCDGQQVGQCLTNLLQNAADSIFERQAGAGSDPIGGTIALTARVDGEQVIIEVVDNGKGLPVELRDQLTEPYVTTRAKGTGLGLAIVKKIMEDHGGDLLLENVEETGAKVSLVFNSPLTSAVARPGEEGTVTLGKAAAHGV